MGSKEQKNKATSGGNGAGRKTGIRIMFLNHQPRRPGKRPEVSDRVIEEMLNNCASPGTTIELAWPDDYPGAKAKVVMDAQLIQNGLDHIMEASPLIKKIVWAAENGYDAVLQSNTFDPGVEGARLAVRIPVIGITRTALHVATVLSERIGILAPLDCHIKEIQRLLRYYEMEHFVSGIRSIGIYGKGMKKRQDEIIEIASSLIRSLVDETGAEYILPLGGALIPYVVDPADLEAATGVPVLNTKSIGVRFTEMCVTLGLSHSPLTYSPAKLSYNDFTQYAYRGA